MPKRSDLRKILIIGSGPIIIGQACEFDYSGTQACKALREEDYTVVPQSGVARSLAEAQHIRDQVGLPCVLRPSFTLGGTGGGIAYNREELNELIAHGLELSPVHEVLVEESVVGWKEFELEVMRDR